jgi:hypothetical protein
LAGSPPEQAMGAALAGSWAVDTPRSQPELGSGEAGAAIAAANRDTSYWRASPKGAVTASACASSAICPARRLNAPRGTSGRASATWEAEVVPGIHQADSVALIDGYQNNEPNPNIIFRQDLALYSLRRASGQPWQGPTKIYGR